VIIINRPCFARCQSIKYLIFKYLRLVEASIGRFQRLFPTFCCDGNGFGFNTNAKRCYHRLSGLSGRGELRFSSGDDLSWLRVCREVSRGRRKFLRAAAMDARIAAIKSGSNFCQRPGRRAKIDSGLKIFNAAYASTASRNVIVLSTKNPRPTRTSSRRYSVSECRNGLCLID